ncbi:MAG: hypothetical protein IJW21_07770 [Clostridia bacterium]|nr:hypothetical protein [Clostridia bacterium]
MKTLRRFTLVLLVLMLAFALTACAGVDAERDARIKAQCETMLDALIARDAEAGYAVMIKEMDKSAFTEAFPALCDYVAGVESYELKQTGWYMGIDNGVSYYRATFLMTSDAGDFQVVGIEVDGYEGLYNFHITSEAELNPSFTGTLTTLAGSSPLQWGMIAFSALSLAFVIWMLVDCIKRKMKYKPLWLIIIICGAIAYTATMNNGSFNMNVTVAIMLFVYSYLKVYSTGAFVFSLVLPIGAVVYLVFRKKFTLTEAPAAHAEEPIAPETIEVGEEDTSGKE